MLNIYIYIYHKYNTYVKYIYHIYNTYGLGQETCLEV